MISSDYSPARVQARHFDNQMTRSRAPPRAGGLVGRSTRRIGLDAHNDVVGAVAAPCALTAAALQQAGNLHLLLLHL